MFENLSCISNLEKVQEFGKIKEEKEKENK